VGEVLDPFLAGNLPDWAGMLGAILLRACVIPIAEEILFRGFMLHSLAGRKTPMRANLIVSLIFAATHLYVWGLPIGAGLYTMGQLFLLSYVLGWAVLRSGSLGPAIVAHGLNNLLALAVS
jgi:membrane protease YdiL (CAAX protease family)